VDLQDGIVGRNRFESNISVPPIAGKFAWLCQRVDSWSGAFLLLDTGDYANLVTKLAVGFSDRMDMKTR
jgi:hypothetical protein